MRYEAILFDLDGTLLPMDNDRFTKGYFHLLAQAARPCGYTEEALIPAMWKGVSAMVKNDGSCTNAERFWTAFADIFGERVYEHVPVFDAFYDGAFHEAKAFTAPNPLAKEAVSLARERADKVILATNPLFPTNAVATRLGWVGLAPKDFDWITDYSNSGACKPNPAYYSEIANKLSLTPQNCLMVGNNAQEDIEAAEAAGLSSFLVTDCLISSGDLPACPQGTFKDLLAFLKTA